MTVLKISAAGLATLALLAGAQAHAQGVITFQSDAPAVGAAVQATQAGRAQAAKPPAQMPGINRVEMPPVSPEDSEAAIRAHPVPANLNPGVQPRAAQASTPGEAWQAQAKMPRRAARRRVVVDSAVAVVAIVSLRLDPNIWLSPLMILGTQWYILFNVIAGAGAIPGEMRHAAASLQVRGWLWWRRVGGS